MTSAPLAGPQTLKYVNTWKHQKPTQTVICRLYISVQQTAASYLHTEVGTCVLSAQLFLWILDSLTDGGFL